MLIDLQLHSTYSDGYLSPTELARFIARQGVKVASLTDHNTVSGLLEFAAECRRLNIRPIPGLELYAYSGSRKFNLLWYNFNPADPDLHSLLRDSQRRRRQLIRAALDRLKRRGYRVDQDAIIDSYNHYVPINHVLDDLLAIPANRLKLKRETGLALPREEDAIFHFFLHRNYPKLRDSFVAWERIMKLRKKVGGQLVLCHPAKHAYIKRDFWLKLKKAGLDGVELLSPHHSYGAVTYIQQLAREFGLITVGGSDFHRLEGSSAKIQQAWQYYRIDSRFLPGVEKIIGRNN